MLVQLASEADDGAIEALSRQCGLSVHAERQRTLPHARLLVARDATSQLLGFAVVWLLGDEAELVDIGVAPERRRSGVGARLLQAALALSRQAGAERVLLEVRKGNHSARRLYERAGFQVAGERPRYYGDGEDAVLYALHHERE